MSKEALFSNVSTDGSAFDGKSEKTVSILRSSSLKWRMPTSPIPARHALAKFFEQLRLFVVAGHQNSQ